MQTRKIGNYGIFLEYKKMPKQIIIFHINLNNNLVIK